MQIRSTRSQHPPTMVAAYLDGTAKMIQPPVLKGYDQFLKADALPEVSTRLTGQRLSQKAELTKSAAFFAGSGAVLGAAAATGALFGLEAGFCLGILALPPALIGARHLQTAFTQTSFEPGPPGPPVEQSNRLRQALEANRAASPEGSQVVYLSGHGSHRDIAGFTPSDLREVLQDSPVDLTVLDACSTAQIEVLSQLVPYAGMILCSAQPVPGKGLPIVDMLKPSDESLPLHAYQAAKDSTTHLGLIDGQAMKDSLLPALDALGRDLETFAREGGRKEIKNTLAKSRNPDVVSARVDLGSFLDKLQSSSAAGKIASTLEQAQEAFDKTVVASTGQSLTFRLDGTGSLALPSGWNSFVQSMGLNFKPLVAV